MKTNHAPFLAAALLAAALIRAEGAEWPRFRGPDGNGIGAIPDVPSAITEKNIRWQTALPGGGHSSPVLWGTRLFTACENPGGQRRGIVCLDADSGRILWTTWLPFNALRMHRDNSQAAATPALDADGIYMGWVNGGRVEALALDHAGKLLWRKDLGAFKAVHGPGASAMVIDEVVVVTNDQESPDAALHGLDRKTGASLWRVERRAGNPSYATPAVRRGKDGRKELVISSPSHGLTGIDPQSGKTLWEVPDILELNVVASPVLGEGVALVTGGRGGEREGAVVALDGETGRLLYRPEAKLPYVPTPVVVGGHCYLWDDQGSVTCLEMKTGKQLWSQRVTGPTYTSPVSDGKRLIGISRKGELVVLAAAPEFRELGRFQLPEGTHATPALAHGSLYIRTFHHLLRVGP
jgi:outer membrane protein assembly factor BamB